ncbi:protein Abitram-like [Littorina saxatilis]|uniref:Protein Abitram n=1 Tax=Littorina saxatilis TaxID=31220 RepID=A0AAN9GIU9_9CAEN
MAQPMCESGEKRGVGLEHSSEMESDKLPIVLRKENQSKQMSDQTGRESNERPPTVVDRYFSKHYRIDLQKKQGEDICILTHSNKICIVTLAPSHPILSEKKTVTDVNFDVGGANRLENKTSGKSKRGALWLGALSPLCTLTCSDESKYRVYCGVKGQLIEVNTALLEAPQLVNQKPWGTGYMGIMLPALKGHEAEMARLLTEDQYQEALKARLASQDT